MCNYILLGNMENPLISVVIPVYNVKKYVDVCLKSVLNQSYHHLQIIIVDDGSDDGCAEICDHYKGIDSRVDVIHQENGGLSAARNTGIERATGEYITFIDSDDYIDRDYISYLVTNIMRESADIAVCQRRNVSEDKKIICENNSKNFVIEGNYECMKEYLCGSSIDTVAWAKLYKSFLFKDLRYPEGKYHEDVFTTYRAISKCNRIAVGGEAKYNYLIRNGSISNQVFSEKHLDVIIGKIEQLHYIERKYTKLEKYARADVVYACNIVALRMIKANVLNQVYVDKIQKLYREYEADFLVSRSSFKAKVFSLFAFINLKLFIKIGIRIRK